MKYPNLNAERRLWKKGYKRVVCLDESGRGPLAGPVVAAAVVIKKFSIFNSQITRLRDSKKLTPKKREEFYKILTKNPDVGWGIGRVSEKVIDKINILEATKLAMKKAVKNLEKKLFHISYDRRKCGIADFLILDGNFKIDVGIPQKSIVKADEKVFSCAVASIIAKVYRDRLMVKYHQKYLSYGFARHKGYPTKEHLKNLRKHKSCSIHRKSFKPVSKHLKPGPE